MDPHFGKVAKQGLDWFLVATEACCGGTPDLGYFLEVCVFIGIFGVGLTSGGGGSLSRPRGTGARLGGRACPPPLWTARDSSGPSPMLCELLLVQKQSPLNFRSIGLRLVFLFCETQKQGKNRT